ncbi:MAG: His-Xaa-Ser system radical SAM maturase HxsB [Candidatus Omnitrophota bacterium]|jgi:His-Xaa-Ser system radical SAM maturase HxsB
MNQSIIKKVDWEKVGFFRFKKQGASDYLLTNDVGEYVILSEKNFTSFLEGTLPQHGPIFEILKTQGLIRDKINTADIVLKYQKKNLFLWQGPSLHIIVVTLRCNQKCIYCQSSSRAESEKGFDLDIATAKKIVDMIFLSPSKTIALEFQGGEPLLNWQTVKFIIEYSKTKNKVEKKNLELRLVSNFSLMDEAKLKFLVANSVTVCTSLDGPEHIHNKNRIWSKGNNHRQAVRWLKKAQKVYKSKLDNKFKPGALLTVSKDSLKCPEAIVNEYITRGLEFIFLRPMTPLGIAKNMWEDIGYTPQEYLKFYTRALNRVISYALKHPKSHFHENTAKIFLAKIITDYDPNFLELRSPCGAGIGQLLYNYDGKVYTCDEGRMVGDEIFCIGNVSKNKYKEIVNHSTVKVLSMASCLDNTSCDLCAYKPYCGVCPIFNWSYEGNIFSHISSNPRCIINKGILDFLFDKLRNTKVKKLFYKWANYTLPAGSQ